MTFHVRWKVLDFSLVLAIRLSLNLTPLVAILTGQRDRSKGGLTTALLCVVIYG
jgi:hypothetical protein